MRFIAFKIRFVENPRFPNERKRDRFIRERLLEELPGIFNWAYLGYCRLRKNNKFTETTEQAEMLRQFQASGDSVMAFVADNNVFCTGDQLRNVTYQKYIEWTKESGRKPMNRNNFYMALERLFERHGVPLQVRKDRSGAYFFRFPETLPFISPPEEAEEGEIQKAAEKQKALEDAEKKAQEQEQAILAAEKAAALRAWLAIYGRPPTREDEISFLSSVHKIKERQGKTKTEEMQRNKEIQTEQAQRVAQRRAFAKEHGHWPSPEELAASATIAIIKTEAEEEHDKWKIAVETCTDPEEKARLLATEPIPF